MAEEKEDGIDRPAKFETVLEAELEQIDHRRQRVGLGEPPQDRNGDGTPLDRAEQKARDRKLVGLAFSGGGIRSATFNLGVLQGLAKLGLLKFIDFLSTVSGGGYIGGWLTAWVRREDRNEGGVAEVERRLGNNPEVNGAARGEAEPVRHLRRHSNYLAPRAGFLSADRWVLWASYLRNFLLNQLVLLPAVIGVLLVSRLVMWGYYPLHQWGERSVVYWIVVAVVFAVVWLAGFAPALDGALEVRGRGAGPAQPPGPEADARMRPRGMAWATGALFASAVVFCWFAPYVLPLGGKPRADELIEPASSRVWLSLVVFAVIGGTLVVLGHLVVLLWRRFQRRPANVGADVVVAFVAGMLGGALLYGTYYVLHEMYYAGDGGLARDYVQVRATARLTTFGPPIVVLAMILAISVGVGLMRHRLGEELREWWSSLCGRLMVVAVLWMSVNLVALYGTALVLWAGPWAQAALGSGWLVTVAAGILAGKDQRTGPARPRKTPLDRLARLAPHVFVVGLLIAVSLLLHAWIDNPPNWKDASDFVWGRTIDPERPATRVSVTTTRKPGQEEPEIERRDVVEREERIEESEIVSQMYWIGILNTDPGHVPTETYRLSDWDLTRLQLAGVAEPLRRTLKAELGRAPGQPGLERDEFVKVMDKLVPVTVPYRHRVRIIQLAKDTQSMVFNRWKRFFQLFIPLLLCVGVGLAASWRVDINLFSLHSVYGNRLVRAYLGASRPRPADEPEARPPEGERRRDPDPVTQMDPDDDLHLADLEIGAERGYDGPFLIVNTALNLVRSDRLDWQERKAESFVLTALYCGSEGTGYRVTAAPAEDEDGYAGNLLLGTAVTLSGAAASPNMGYHSSPSVTALLTVFNARLGGWLGNPASPTHWRQPGPVAGFLHLFLELFGATDSDGKYVYLSDGGHFENLGAYELVRRRCQYVIVSDSGQDPEHCFEDLANLIRKCRTDLGIGIEIDLDAVRLDQPRHSRWHCGVGRIRYDLVDDGAMPGTLIYLKPSLTGDEPADVRDYADRFHDFPHETTADQFFSESQLESYRALGEHVAEAVFAPSVGDMNDATRRLRVNSPEAESPGRLHRFRCRELFTSLVRRWFAMPPEYEPIFLETTRGYVDIQEALRGDIRLWRLTLSLYPELDRDGIIVAPPRESVPEQAARRCAELHVIAQMLQVMENAWLSLRLDVHYAHPLNRGWMDVFHRWTGSPVVREHWPVVRSEFNRGFISFCEKQMRLGAIEGTVAQLIVDAIPAPLDREFSDQWPEQRRLEERMMRAREGSERLAWLIYPTGTPLSATPTGTPAAAPPRPPAGIILLEPLVTVGTREYEFFVWMRGAYRNTGLGRNAVGLVLNQLRERWPEGFRLFVRLPVGDLTGPGGDLQQRMWLTFFHHHDFVRPEAVRETAGTNAGEEAELVLERVFQAP